MGIVYKFRKEVIDFVLHQKRTDHDLGCRQLAALTSEKFKIQVSKSSINAIIKNANLSNTVGRPLSTESSPKRRFCVMLKTCGRGARKTKGSCAKARDVSFSRRRSGSSRGLLFWVVYCENISKNHCPRDSTRFVMYCLV